MLHTDRPERTTPGAVLRAGDRTLVVESARPHQGRWLVRFEGITDLMQADYKNAGKKYVGTYETLSAVPDNDAEQQARKSKFYRLVGKEMPRAKEPAPPLPEPAVKA